VPFCPWNAPLPSEFQIPTGRGSTDQHCRWPKSSPFLFIVLRLSAFRWRSREPTGSLSDTFADSSRSSWRIRISSSLVIFPFSIPLSASNIFFAGRAMDDGDDSKSIPFFFLYFPASMSVTRRGRGASSRRSRSHETNNLIPRDTALLCSDMKGMAYVLSPFSSLQ
jgi:hypothetical protein